MADASLLVAHLREPERLVEAGPDSWNALIRQARAEVLIGQLGARAHEAGIRDRLPARVRLILDEADIAAAASQRFARWEAREAARVLRPLSIPVVLLKGAAYVHAGLPPAEGRTVGDLDILLPRAALPDAEAALVAGGWAHIKSDPYDDAYYRRWMHELPPLAHSERGTLIDVHHTILPLTARLKPNAEALLAGAIPVGGGLSVLSPPDMLLHSAVHMFHDGDFEGGLRNLWDIHRLLERFDSPAFRSDLGERARLHGLAQPLGQALRFARDLFGSPVDPKLAGRAGPLDALIRRRLLARDAWGAPTRPLARQALYMRSHWLRMPPAMLARHLFTKWRMRRS